MAWQTCFPAPAVSLGLLQAASLMEFTPLIVGGGRAQIIDLIGKAPIPAPRAIWFVIPEAKEALVSFTP